ncbi:hypothetical protein CHY_0823 [Carboxydothermus hydrogenoformans Z-2901]|uniref:Uncharacterized protein n=1 Tax=Carboxydothermus hydrogenoformans (strain ATCC BAA-161 / DSM 6008 / Z-2901) TaxID=246194 RepID=Q3ADV7_CARHZ|nr:hypothetical protein CHY_0823 [Carboxydothermus hydrogenoformans Z-2901]
MITTTAFIRPSKSILNLIKSVKNGSKSFAAEVIRKGIEEGARMQGMELVSRCYGLKGEV